MKSPQKAAVLIDSGAYSAWRLGKAVDLDKYCDYLLANLDWIDNYIALDVIDPAGPDIAAAKSYENLRHMLARGLKPIPVYHAGEDISWLKKMLDLGCDYIALAGLSLGSPTKRQEWYAWAWAHLVNHRGEPIVKVHALGEGRIDSLLRFPWASADSTSWIYTAQRTGVVTMPGGARVGMRNDGVNTNTAPDVADLSPEDREHFEAILRKHGIAKTVFELRGDKAERQEGYVLRTYIEALYYIDNQEKVRARHPVRWLPHGFFHSGLSDRPRAKFPRFNFYFVGGTNHIAYSVLAWLNHPYVLASYFYIDDSDKDRPNVVKNFREYATDPRGWSSSQQPWLGHWNILKKHLTCA